MYLLSDRKWIFRRYLGTCDVHNVYHVYKSLPLVPVLRQINPAHDLLFTLLEYVFILCSLLGFDHPNILLFLGFPPNCFVFFLSKHVPHIITIISSLQPNNIWWGVQILDSFFLQFVFHFHNKFSVFGPNVFLNISCSSILSSCFLHSLRGHISHSCIRKDNIIVL